MKFTFFLQPPERPPKKLHLLKKVSKPTNHSHQLEITHLINIPDRNWRVFGQGGWPDQAVDSSTV